jgi:hypothetical protein
MWMKATFSEFSYGYAVTEDIIHHFGRPTIAPIFPNLSVEGKLGYDLKLDVPGQPLFLQFKLSDCLVTARPHEAQSGLLRSSIRHVYV